MCLITCAIIFPLAIDSLFLDMFDALLRSVVFTKVLFFSCSIFCRLFVLRSLSDTLMDLPLCIFIIFNGRFFFVSTPRFLFLSFWFSFVLLYVPLFCLVVFAFSY